MKLLITGLMFFAGTEAFAANGCTLSNGTAISHGATGCENNSQVSCSNGIITYDSDAGGNAISCGAGINGAAKKNKLQKR